MTGFSLATAILSKGVRVGMVRDGASAMDLKVFDTIDGVKSIANELLVPTKADR